jgi:hypothetical protein
MNPERARRNNAGVRMRGWGVRGLRPLQSSRAAIVMRRAFDGLLHHSSRGGMQATAGVSTREPPGPALSDQMTAHGGRPVCSELCGAAPHHCMRCVCCPVQPAAAAGSAPLRTMPAQQCKGSGIGRRAHLRGACSAHLAVRLLLQLRTGPVQLRGRLTCAARTAALCCGMAAEVPPGSTGCAQLFILRH